MQFDLGRLKSTCVECVDFGRLASNKLIINNTMRKFYDKLFTFCAYGAIGVMTIFLFVVIGPIFVT